MDGRKTHLIAGDPLRAIAAVSVLIYHCAWLPRAYQADFEPGGAPYTSLGHLPSTILANLADGLYVFFALSGYLLARPFLRTMIDGAPAPDLGGYFRNRLLRIVPAFWVVFALTLLIAGSRGSTWLQLAAVPAFVQNYVPSPFDIRIGQAWTLDVEIGFYLLLPFGALALAWVTRGLSRRGRVAAALAATGAVGLVSLALNHAATTLTFERSLPATLFPFTPGIAVAVLDVAWGTRPVDPRGGRRLSLALAALAAALLIAPTLFVGPKGLEIGLVTLGASLLVAAPLVRQRATGAVWKVLDNRVLKWIGVRAYSVYLAHVLVIDVLKPIWSSVGGAAGRVQFAAMVGLALPTTLAFAAVLHRAVERPFLDLRTRWRPLPAAGPAAAAQAPEPGAAPIVAG